MNDELTVILIESINLNPNLTPTQKLDLVKKTMSDCQDKKIGKIITDEIKRQGEKRGRGRPRKISDNELKMLKTSRDADIADGRIKHD